MKYIIFVGHGSVPYDFPQEKLKKYFFLRSKKMKGELNKEEKKEFLNLERELHYFERNAENDPHYFFHKKLKDEIEKELNIKCYFAFNEFCAPNLEEVIEEIVKNENNSEIFIVPTMFTGGHHTDEEIKEEIEKIKEKFKNLRIKYLYPFNFEYIKELFEKHIKEVLK
ncbi:MAG: CbiX/SirB N-terminal domain-containing protein [candidate division WOR-3 bacterium]